MIQPTISVSGFDFDLVESYKIAAHLGKSRVARLTLPDPTGQITDLAIASTSLTFSLDYGPSQDLIFSGKIYEPKYPQRKQVELLCYCDFRKLQIEKFTLTLINQYPSDMLSYFVGKKLGLDVTGIEIYNTMLDRLPLNEMTVIDALRFIHRRMALSHDYWMDTDGVFHWQERNTDQDAVHAFEIGYDADNFDRDNGTFTTEAITLDLCDIVTVIDEDDDEYTCFITGLEWSDTDDGSEIKVFIDEVTA